MPKVVREDIDNLNTILTITVQKSDYEPKLSSELKKYRNQAHLKGFRKGKTPMSVVRKMFGKNALAEIVNEAFQKTLYDYIKDEKLEVLGQPILADDQEPLDFDMKFLNDFEIQFELGLAPDIEINGLGKTQTLTNYKVAVEDEIIEQDLTNAQKRLGTMDEPEEDIQEEDSLRLEAKELDEQGALKEDGLSSTFSVLVKDLNDAIKGEFLSKKKGDTIKVDLSTLENHERGEEEQLEFIRQYYLNLPPEDETSFNLQFEATITQVSRLAEAELNEDFYQKLFGPDTEVNDKEGAKAMIRKDYDDIYSKQTDSLLYRSIMNKLLELNDFPLPDNFLKKWLKATNGEKIEKRLEEEYDKFATQTRRSILFTKLKDKYEIDADQEEIVEKARESARQMVAQYLGGNEAFVDQLANRALQDEKQFNAYYEQVVTDKLIDQLLPEVNTEEQFISVEEFHQQLESINQSIQEGQPNFFDEEEE